LELPAEVVAQAILDTECALDEAKEAAWRAKLSTHAVILVARRISEPIFVAGIIGVEQLRVIDLDPTKGTITYVKQALDGLHSKLARRNPGVDVSNEHPRALGLPGYGRLVGFVVNYTPDYAIQFDPRGNPIAILDRAYRLGMVELSLGKHRHPLTGVLLSGFGGLP
jgi:hypothetical protein